MTAQNIHTKTKKATALSLSKGFTLIELLVVIGILAILLGITIVAINPSRQFGQGNDTKRRSDVTQILNAIGQYAASNSGNLPAELAALTVDTPTLFSDTAFGTLCTDLAGDYIPALPADPSLNNPSGIEDADCAVAGWNTGYTVARDGNNRVTVSATSAYSGPITVTR